MKHNTLAIIAHDHPGVLVKVATIISGRGLNIYEVTARVSERPGFTYIYIDFLGEEEKLRQVCGQLEKLEAVEEVTLLTA